MKKIKCVVSMAKIDVEKFICSLMQFTPVSGETKNIINRALNCALKGQGLEYKNGAIVKVKKNSTIGIGSKNAQGKLAEIIKRREQYMKGYKEAIVDAIPFWISCIEDCMGTHMETWNKESKENTINKFHNIMEQNLKKKKSLTH